jgi:hypothetical protein
MGARRLEQPQLDRRNGWIVVDNLYNIEMDVDYLRRRKYSLSSAETHGQSWTAWIDDIGRSVRTKGAQAGVRWMFLLRLVAHTRANANQTLYWADEFFNSQRSR